MEKRRRVTLCQGSHLRSNFSAFTGLRDTPRQRYRPGRRVDAGPGAPGAAGERVEPTR